ncbi:MAG: phosphoenolpyruvate carboxykinase domain-containing protein, partial [Bacteroidota bacterium]
YKGKTEEIVAFNYLFDENDIYIGDIIIVPNGVMPPPSVKLQPAPASVPLADSYFIVPVSSPYIISQGLHWYNAIDFDGKCGDPIYAAAAGQVGTVRRDPMAMLPFIGYHMADYFNHWLQFGRNLPNPPRIFCVNWFRKDENGEFLWPGFSENMRVLRWIVNRVHGRGYAIESPLGWMPRHEDINWEGLESLSPDAFNKLMVVNSEEWKAEILSHEEMFSRLYDRLPREFTFMKELIRSALWRSPEHWMLAHE